MDDEADEADEAEELEFWVTAKIVIDGAGMVVMAKDAAEARAKAEANPDFDYHSGALVDWKITRVTPA